MNRLRDLLTPASHGKYLSWRALSRAFRPPPVTLRLVTGERLLVRPKPATDLDTAYEIFVDGVYASALTSIDARSIRRIVDLGANVGYSAVWWASRCPEATILAVEPHPANVASLRRNVSLNGLGSRVVVEPVAACSSPREVTLSDAGSSSSIVRSAGTGFKVQAVDFFELVGGGPPVDLLKMDIEGGEYELLSDARFAKLRPRTIAMEWHVTDEHPDAAAWCSATLEKLGYETRRGADNGAEAGMLWASLSRDA